MNMKNLKNPMRETPIWLSYQVLGSRILAAIAVNLPAIFLAVFGYSSVPLIGLDITATAFVLPSYTYLFIIFSWAISIFDTTAVTFQYLIFILTNSNGESPNFPTSIKVIFASALIMPILITKFMFSLEIRKVLLFRIGKTFLLILVLFTTYKYLSPIPLKKFVHKVFADISLVHYITNITHTRLFEFFPYTKSSISFITSTSIYSKSDNTNFLGMIQSEANKVIANGGDVIIIVNESWSFFNDNDINNSIIEPIKSSKFDITVGLKSWTPSKTTLGAEAQAICHTPFSEINEISFEKIILAELVEKNLCFFLQQIKHLKYKSHYFHSASVNYGGRLVFREIFDSVFFDDYPNQSDMKRCDYGWPGLCDRAVLSYMLGKIKANKSKEIRGLYVFTTVNTHTPLIDPVDFQSKSHDKCSDFRLTSKSEMLCSLFLQQHDLFYGLSQTVVPNLEKNDLLVILSDHPMRFLKFMNKAAIYNYQVPFMLVKKL